MNNFFKPVDRQKKFEKVSKDKDEWTKRELEPQLLKPELLPAYDGPLPKTKCSLDKRCVRIVFPSEKDMDIVNKFMTISESFRGVKYITNISLMIEFCKRLETDKELHDSFSEFIAASREKGIEVCDLPDDIEEDGILHDIVEEDDVE